MADLLEIVLTQMIEKHKTDIEISFVARIVSYDKSKMTAEISPQLQADTPGAKKTKAMAANIKDVRIERSPGVRPIYKPNDLVKVVCSASPIDEAIENGRPVDTLGHKFSISFCTITGRVNPRTFAAPSHYSNDGLILSEDPDFYINFKTDQIYFNGKTVLADNLEVKGNTRSLTTHTELNTGLQTEAGLIQAELVKIAAAINALAPGSYAPGTVSIDISAAKTDNIKTGAG